MTADDAVHAARTGGRLQMSETEAKAVLASEGVAVTMPRPASSATEAARLAQEIGFPVVMKVDSPDIVHKSDVGGVKLGILTAREVSRAYREMRAEVSRRAPQARVSGVTVQAMAPAGVEVIVGASWDAQFGPVVMFGLGGVLVELLRDVSFRIVPLSRWDAERMVEELKGAPLLRGFRGRPAASLDALAGLLVTVSRLMERRPDIAELDLNPVIAYPHGVVAVDARIALRPAAGGRR